MPTEWTIRRFNMIITALPNGRFNTAKWFKLLGEDVNQNNTYAEESQQFTFDWHNDEGVNAEFAKPVNGLFSQSTSAMIETDSLIEFKVGDRISIGNVTSKLTKIQTKKDTHNSIRNLYGFKFQNDNIKILEIK